MVAEHLESVGWVSVVGIVTRYVLEGPVIKSRWVRDFSSLGPSQPRVQLVPGLFPRGLALTTNPRLSPMLKSAV